jgi:hypothetical protein
LLFTFKSVVEFLLPALFFYLHVLQLLIALAFLDFLLFSNHHGFMLLLFALKPFALVSIALLLLRHLSFSFFFLPLVFSHTFGSLSSFFLLAYPLLL